MSKKHIEPTEETDPRDPQLRAEAEALLRRAPLAETPALSDDQLLHELQVHQVELEMQNEELRRTQISLEESRDRYVDLYDFAPVGYLTLNRGGLISEVNLAGAALLGGERANLLKHRFDHFVAPEDHDQWLHLFKNTMESAGEEKGIELKLRRDDGTATCVHLDCLRTEVAGAPPQLRMAMTDISAMQLNSQLIAAQDNLREQLLFQASLLESIPVPIFYKDCQGRYQGCNRAYEEILDKKRSEIIGKSVFDMAPPEIADKYHAKDAELFRHPGRQMYEWMIQKPSGEIRNVLFHKATFLRNDGAVGGLIGALVDITELKRKDAALEESEERLRATTETARDAIVVLEAEHGTIAAWNPAAEVIFGYPRAEALGQVLHDLLVPPRFREAARQGLAHFSHSGEGAAIGKTLELVALHKDGTEFPIELSLSAMQIHGKWHATGIIRDITERKRAEEALLRSNRELLAISHCNLTLMRADDELTLLNELCRIICTEAGYRLAWVGYPENDAAKTIRPVAWAGAEEGFLAQTTLTWADTERGRGPCGTAIQSGESICIPDFATAPQSAPWRDYALQRGYRSSIALPLKNESGNAFGVLNIYSAEPDAFTPEEIRLLNELSGDLAFGIMVLRTRIERKRLEQESQAHLRFVENMDRVNRALLGTNDLDQMLSNVLDAVLTIFDCDRAWLVYPCDPEAPFWSVPMERTKPEYPGASVRGLKIPMSPEIQEVFRTSRATNSPVPLGPGSEHPLPEWLREQFGVQSQLAVATYPRIGKPWQFGMHQCAYARAWTQEEQRLFQEINRRLTDGLTGLLSHRELQESEAKYRSIVETTSDWIWEIDENAVYTYASPRIRAILGYEPAEVIGKTPFDLMPEEEAQRVAGLFGPIVAAQELLTNLENTCLHKDGHPVILETSGVPVIDPKGKFCGYRGIDRDITERKRAEAAFRQVSRHNELILESAGEGIYGADVDGRIVFINPAALVMLGYAKDELVGRDSHVALHHSKPDGSPYRQQDCPMHQSLLSGLAAQAKEETLWRKNGSPLPVLFSSTPIREAGEVAGTVVAFQDITELKRYQTQLERQSNYDDLTGLPNRNLLTDRLGRAVARCLREQKKLAVLTLNLDRFREINDSLGRAVGDSILREAAGRLRRLMREMDTLARTGGDEFVLVGEIEKEEEAAFLAQRILETLSQPVHLEGREISLHAGVGISVLPKDGGNGESLLNNALAAMYRAKASGGNNFLFYSAKMNAHTLEQLNLENDLRRAIESDELLLYYQPQLSLRNGEIIGMEALLRWRHPVRGLVSPMEFIPLAEATGLIVPIGEWVMRTACTQNRAWQAAGLPAVAVAVNLSARQFEAQDMVALTARVLRETGLNPNFLELELTESAAMGNADSFIGVTESLKGLGVTLSIDDFGTGYSSLSYLKRFAIDRLKIDQSFVRDIVQDSESASIAVAVIALAHGLGLSVIAEGVETEAQLNFLRVRGCDEMQGYYFSKPLPAAEFEQLLREKRKLAFSTAAELPRHTLLLVDDEPAILSALNRQLRREGYRILTATSARAGLELLATHEVAVVMSDQRMPEMTGAEFLAKVRAMYPDTVRIILSGYTELRSITEVVNRGEIYKFLEKPWEEAALKETLREAFRHYEARRAVRADAI